MTKKIILCIIFSLYAANCFSIEYDVNELLGSLYKQAQTAIEKGDQGESDFFLARYLGLVTTENTTKNYTDLYPLFDTHKQLNAFTVINGEFQKEFIDWFIFAGYSMWAGQTIIQTKDGALEVTNNLNDNFYVGVFGYPYLEKGSIVGGTSNSGEVVVMTLMRKPFLVLGKIKEKENPLDNASDFPIEVRTVIQYIWQPEFYDIDKDGEDEIFIRYNKSWATGFSQVLDIYKIKEDDLILWERFEGLAEGIAMRAGDKIIVGEGFSDTGNGHMGYEKTHIEEFEYKEDKWIRTKASDQPHILLNEEWKTFYL
ncbi:MAG: hypothetical protein PHQ52_00275 [Candidatus Omnitrophica bacterium]|nr:hypothetical protein [Candidatus Omnitrophota bacterium]